MLAITNILVATDFSKPSSIALNYGGDLARSYGATLHVIHVLEDLVAFHGGEVGFAMADIERNIEAAARRDLEAAISDADRASLKVRTITTRAANVPREITEYARRNEIDLIIVGTHGHGAIHRFLIGSVAERVMRTAPCPVLTVREHERDFITADSGDAAAEIDRHEARM